jgi:hypothetical protein
MANDSTLAAYVIPSSNLAIRGRRFGTKPADAERVRYPLSTLGLFLAGILLPRPLCAQCASNASSCVNCHEAQGLRPVLQSAQPWHADHAFGDLCSGCHAGDPLAPTKLAAHVGVRQPFADLASACAPCHPNDAIARGDRYLALLRKPIAASPARGAGRSGVSTTANIVLAACAVLLSGALIVAFRRGRVRAAAARTQVARPPVATIHPYAAGTLLGLVVAVSEVAFSRPLAAAGAFDKLAAYLGRWLFPTSQYYARIMTPGITWQVWVIAGVLFGAWAGSALSRQARVRWLPDTQWVPRFGERRAPRLAIAFLGAVLVQVGAGIAGGCTSGLAISGGAALAPGAFVFMAGMFAGGIPTAWLWYRGRSE